MYFHLRRQAPTLLLDERPQATSHGYDRLTQRELDRIQRKRCNDLMAGRSPWIYMGGSRSRQQPPHDLNVPATRARSIQRLRQVQLSISRLLPQIYIFVIMKQRCHSVHRPEKQFECRLAMHKGLTREDRFLNVSAYATLDWSRKARDRLYSCFNFEIQTHWHHLHSDNAAHGHGLISY